MTNRQIFVGNIVSSDDSMKLNCFNGYLKVVNGLITEIGTREEFHSQANQLKRSKIVNLNQNEFLMPGLVDCHIHAPQFPNIGLGLNLPFLEWLEKYTFPLEKKYSDVYFASQVYDMVVKKLIDNGTTTACYFGSLHLEGTLELVKSVIAHHQRALVGKVSMNVKNDAGYYNSSTKRELWEVDNFVNKVLYYKNGLVQPIITPRSAMCCDDELMKGLAEIAEKYNCGIQSHISENKQKIDYVLKTHSECSTCAEVYERCGIFKPRCIMAHAVHLSEDEMITLCRLGVSVAHCPASNTRLVSGLCPVRKLLQKQVCVGLGTDISGGDNPSILDAMRRAMDVSIHLAMFDKTNAALDWKEVFYLATLGGAKALGLNDKIGNFEVGRCFDALLVDVYSEGGPIDKYEHSTGGDAILELVQRFVYLGDNRNVKQVYVQGKLVKGTSDL